MIVHAGPRHAVPEGHRRRRQGRRPQGAVHRLGHRATPTPGRATCATGSTTGSTASSATPASTATVGGERHQLPPGVLPVQARRLEARVPPQHEQQLVGRRLQRGGPRLRLDRQRLPERLHADPEPLLRVGPRLVAERARRTSPTRTSSSRSPTRSGRSTGTAASPPAAGHALYTARTYPKQYWNRTAFVAEPTGHLVATFTLAAATAATSARTTRWNLLASDDEWTAPILAEVGPDGNVWVIDWYNYIVQHNPTPAGLQDRQGRRLRDPAARQDARPDLPDRRRRTASRATGRRCSTDDPKGLVAALKNDNMFWRLHAQRLLVERGKTDVVPDLIALVERPVGRRDRPEPGRDPRPLDAARPGRARRPDEAVAAAVDGGAEASVGRRPAQRGRRSLPARRRRPRPILDAGPAGRPRPAGPPRRAAGPGRLPRVGRGRGGAVASAARRRARSTATAGSPTPPRAAAAGTTPSVPRSARRPQVDDGRRRRRCSCRRRARRRALRPRRRRPTRSARCSPRSADADPQVAEAVVAGLAKGWPKDKPADARRRRREGASPRSCRSSRPTPRGQLRRPGLALGRRRGSTTYVAELAKDLLAAAADESKPDAARVDAARQLDRPPQGRRRRPRATCSP